MHGTNELLDDDDEDDSLMALAHSRSGLNDIAKSSILGQEYPGAQGFTQSVIANQQSEEAGRSTQIQYINMDVSNRKNYGFDGLK